MSILFTASRLMKASEVKEWCQATKAQPFFLQYIERQIKEHCNQYIQEQKEKTAS